MMAMFLSNLSAGIRVSNYLDRTLEILFIRAYGSTVSDVGEKRRLDLFLFYFFVDFFFPFLSFFLSFFRLSLIGKLVRVHQEFLVMRPKRFNLLARALLNDLMAIIAPIFQQKKTSRNDDDNNFFYFFVLLVKESKKQIMKNHQREYVVFFWKIKKDSTKMSCCKKKNEKSQWSRPNDERQVIHLVCVLATLRHRSKSTVSPNLGKNVWERKSQKIKRRQPVHHQQLKRPISDYGWLFFHLGQQRKKEKGQKETKRLRD